MPCSDEYGGEGADGASQGGVSCAQQQADEGRNAAFGQQASCGPISGGQRGRIAVRGRDGPRDEYCHVAGVWRKQRPTQHGSGTYTDATRAGSVSNS